MDISFIIVNWNTRQLLLDSLSSIRDTVKGFEYEVFVVDNGSTDGSQQAVREQYGAMVHLIENTENQGFARANNQAIKRAAGRYVILLNSDTVLRDNTVSGLVQFLDDNPGTAMAGPRMVYDDGSPQNSYDNFPTLTTELLNKSILRLLFPGRYSGKAAKNAPAFEVDSLIGACIAIRAEAIKKVGMFDEDYFFFLEETDWCLRMRRAGWKIYHVPQAEIVHLQGRSKRHRPALSWIEYYRSLYKFFKKNRSPASYYALRIFRFFKLIINLVLTVLALCVTLGRKPRYREKTAVYSRILWWHLCLCPDDVGLRKP